MSDANICTHSHLHSHTKQANNLSPYHTAEPEIGWWGALEAQHGLPGPPGLFFHINELKWASGWRQIWRVHWFSVLLGLQEWHHVSQGSWGQRQVRTLISLGPVSLREESTHGSTMGSPKFLIPESPPGPWVFRGLCLPVTVSLAEAHAWTTAVGYHLLICKMVF